MSVSAADKKDIILKYVEELGFRPVEISRATRIPFFTVNQLLHCDEWETDERVLDSVLEFLEGKTPEVKEPFCTSTGCDAMKACMSEKDHLIKTQEETIKMLREKIKRLSK